MNSEWRDIDEVREDEEEEELTTCCKCQEKFEDYLNSPMCDDCFEGLGETKEERLHKYSLEVHGVDLSSALPFK
jgi:hypothetical protein